MSINLKKYYLIHCCFLSFLLVFTTGILKQQKLLTTLSYATLTLSLSFLITFTILRKSNSQTTDLLKSDKNEG